MAKSRGVWRLSIVLGVVAALVCLSVASVVHFQDHRLSWTSERCVQCGQYLGIWCWTPIGILCGHCALDVYVGLVLILAIPFGAVFGTTHAVAWVARGFAQDFRRKKGTKQ